MEKVEYGGWPNCVRLANGDVELVATTDVGPRILRLGFQGERNLFKEFEDQLGQAGSDQWHPYGGHRFWHSPEGNPRTYFPDNSRVEADWDETRLKLTQPVEATTGMQKELEITLGEGGHVIVLHRLINTNLWEVECAPWALTVMAPGGRAIVPQEPYAPHPDALLPARPVAVWPYTNMADPRLTWGRHFITLRQDDAGPLPIKFGVRNTLGFAVYALDGFLFIKTARFNPEARYPDFNCSMEFFTDKGMLEMESLGPLERLAPQGGTAEHTEHWLLHRQRLPEDEDEMTHLLEGIFQKTQRFTEPHRERPNR